MTKTRRAFLTSAAATAGTITLFPFSANAGGHMANEFKSSAGTVTVHPIQHASIVLETPVGTIYVDPVGDAASYSDMPPADLVLVTHEHGDHLNNDVLAAVVGDATVLISNAGAQAKMTPELQARARVLGNGDTTEFGNMIIDAIPAYNVTEERKNFHPQGRDNGYVLTIGDFRIYISGDSEDTPEMRALKDIDLAFVCMNIPFTMDAKAAASAVAEFRPSYVYPYHYRGRDEGTQDPAEFAALVGDKAEVKFGDWYG
jgi:L-ascorbate metabolism protein UlaG (beta-lactamase superfamily)